MVVARVAREEFFVLSAAAAFLDAFLAAFLAFLLASRDRTGPLETFSPGLPPASKCVCVCIYVQARVRIVRVCTRCVHAAHGCVTCDVCTHMCTWMYPRRLDPRSRTVSEIDLGAELHPRHGKAKLARPALAIPTRARTRAERWAGKGRSRSQFGASIRDDTGECKRTRERAPVVIGGWRGGGGGGGGGGCGGGVWKISDAHARCAEDGTCSGWLPSTPGKMRRSPRTGSPPSSH